MNVLARLALLVALSAAAAPAAGAFYCGRDLVEHGDPIYRVAEDCPEPFWTEAWQHRGPNAGLVYPLGDAGPVDTYEAWYLNFGSNKLMRRLVFRNGYLVRAQELDHGFDGVPGRRRCRVSELHRAGNTAAAIYAACGQPDYQLEYPAVVHHDAHGRRYVAYRSRWVYELGHGTLPRVLHFEDGRLVDIDIEER